MSGEVVLVVNTASRLGRSRFAQAKLELERRGLRVTSAHAVRNPRDLPGIVKKQIDGEAPIIVVGGGDGTLSSISGAFVASKSILGVLPLGTGNEFARDLCIPTDLEAACDIIADGEVAAVDLGVVNERYFVNVATVGLTTLIAQELTNEAKRRWGKFVYVFALLRSLARVHPFLVTMETSEGQHSFETVQVVVGNGRFHAGPFPLAPDATITDGKLVVYALHGSSRWTLLRYALNLPGGHHVELPNVESYTVSSGRILTKPTQRVTVDGEIALRTPLNFGVAPQALRVLVPKNSL